MEFSENSAVRIWKESRTVHDGASESADGRLRSHDTSRNHLVEETASFLERRISRTHDETIPMIAADRRNEFMRESLFTTNRLISTNLYSNLKTNYFFYIIINKLIYYNSFRPLE